MTSPYSHRFVPTLKTPTKQTGGRSPSLIKIVLTAGAVTLGFEVAQQFLARSYYRHAWKVYMQKKKSGQLSVLESFRTSSPAELRSQWMPKFYKAMGGDVVFWLLKNPRYIPHDMRAYICIASLWISLRPEDRKKFKSRDEFYDFCKELGGSIRDLLIKREGKL